MSFLDGFIAGRILNSSSNNNGKDDSKELKRSLAMEKGLRQNEEELNRIRQHNATLLRNDQDDVIKSLKRDNDLMRDSRDKCAKIMNLLKEEKKLSYPNPCMTQ